MLLYLHHVPGRLRIQTAGLRGNLRLGALVSGRLAAIAGVAEAVANPVTGSLIVRYDPARAGLEILWDALRATAVVSGPLPPLDGRGYEMAAPPIRSVKPARLAETLGTALAEALIQRSVRALIGALI